VTRPKPRLTLALPTCGPAAAGGPRPIVDLAVSAEALGVGAVAVADHVLLGADTSGYPFGDFPLLPAAPFLEPLSTLMAVATATERIRVTTGILVAPLRRAAVLAKTVATIDAMSAGRVELGVGVGWHRPEYDACGVDFGRRGVVLDDTIGACRALWSAPSASFASSTVAFTRANCVPLPVQQPLPVLFAGSLHARNVRRIVALGDGWIPVMGAAPAIVADGVALLADAFRAAGRDTDALRVRSELAPVVDARGRPDIRATLDAAPALRDAGVSDVQFPMPYFVTDPARAHDVLERVAAAWADIIS
jgi:probable F420-dependent oxidoreductase